MTSRRTFITNGCLIAAAFTAAGAAGAELVSRGVLPGRTELEKLDGACSVPAPPVPHGAPGPSLSGTFRSAARRRPVGYTIAYPPGHHPGDELPLVVMLHGYGATHASALAGMSPSQALALRPGGRPPSPVAMVTVDGGNGYWNPHPDDDPLAMVIDELIPRCQRLGLGRAPRRIAAMGISMGGYGALLLAEKYPRLFTAVAGWGGGVFSAGGGWWWVPVVAPVVGAILGAWLYDICVGKHLPVEAVR